MYKSTYLCYSKFPPNASPEKKFPVYKNNSLRTLAFLFPAMYNTLKEKTERMIPMRYGFGIDLGGTTVKIAFFEENGTMLDKWEIPTVREGGGEKILPDIAGAVDCYLEQKHIGKDQVLGLGIGVPGPVDGRGVVNRCVNLGWGVFNIAEELSRLTDLPVKAGNDANVAALGEFWKGGGQDFGSIVFITLGTGVGGGIVMNGQLLHGAHGSAAEIGHLILNREEAAACTCGNHGCAEQYCSATGIVRLAKIRLAKDGATSALRNYENLTCKDIFDEAKNGDGLAQAVLEEFYDYLGQLIGLICSTLDPEAVVIGGGVSKAGAVILEGVARHSRRYTFHAATGAKLLLASLGNDAGAYGAFKLALDAFG